MNREIKFRVYDEDLTIYKEFPKYGVSKNGKVYSFDYNHSGKCKEIHQYKDKDGYFYVYLMVDGKRYKRLVHRMILSSFISNPENKPQVNHINGIRNDNRLENLEWVTAKDNALHSYRSNGRKQTIKQRKLASDRFTGINNPKSKINFEIVCEIRKDRKLGMFLKDISKKYNISISQCSQICNNKFWKVIGNVWENEVD